MWGKVQTWALTACLCRDRMWRWRKWFWFDWFIAVTPFFMDYEILCFKGRPVQKNRFRCFGEIQSVSYSDMAYTRVHTVQQRERWGSGWVVLPGTDWCTQSSPQRGSLCGLEWVSAPLRCVGITDCKTQWGDCTGGGGVGVVAVSSSSSGLHHREICVYEHVSFFRHARPQKAAWKAMWCHPLLTAERGSAGTGACRAGGMSGWRLAENAA